MNLETISEYDLIGQEINISQSKNKEIIGLKGKVIMETKNMITLQTCLLYTSPSQRDSRAYRMTSYD